MLRINRKMFQISIAATSQSCDFFGLVPIYLSYDHILEFGKGVEFGLDEVYVMFSDIRYQYQLICNHICIILI